MVAATDDPARLILGADMTSESSFQTEREGIRNTGTEEAWTVALNNET